MDDSRNHYDQTKHQDVRNSRSSKDILIQAVVAVTAVAALAVSVAGLVWSKESATAAKQSAAAAMQQNQIAAEAYRLAEQADSRTVQSQESAQAHQVSDNVHWSTTDGSTQYYVEIINLSANNINNVVVTYGITATPLYYVDVNIVGPCTEWWSQEEQQFSLQAYFEDSEGNYWEMNSSGVLHNLTGQPDLSGLTDETSTWAQHDDQQSCAP
jgi:hypothetical protein